MESGFTGERLDSLFSGVKSYRSSDKLPCNDEILSEHESFGAL